MLNTTSGRNPGLLFWLEINLLLDYENLDHNFIIRTAVHYVITYVHGVVAEGLKIAMGAGGLFSSYI